MQVERGNLRAPKQVERSNSEMGAKTGSKWKGAIKRQVERSNSEMGAKATTLPTTTAGPKANATAKTYYTTRSTPATRGAGSRGACSRTVASSAHSRVSKTAMEIPSLGTHGCGCRKTGLKGRGGVRRPAELIALIGIDSLWILDGWGQNPECRLGRWPCEPGFRKGLKSLGR